MSRAPIEHEVKVWPPHFDDLASGRKPFELRFDDRDYQVGDTFVGLEWIPSNDALAPGTYTGKRTRQGIKYVLRDVPQFGLGRHFAILGLEPLDLSGPDPVGFLRAACLRESVARGLLQRADTDITPACARRFTDLVLDLTAARAPLGASGPLSEEDAETRL